MKKNLILLFLIFLLSCSKENQQTAISKCPNVFFAKEHKIYISSEEYPLEITNISYKAELNNYLFNKECSFLNNFLSSNISILFIVKPENLSQADILLPYYIAMLNQEDEIIDIQYYSVQGVMQKDTETSNYIETELIDTIDIRMFNKDLEENFKISFVVGFMLDKEKMKILN